MFRAKGIENTSMNDIARATGYSKATLYVYFKNKEEIIRYPLYFKMVLENINIDFETRDFSPEEKETFLIGESINELIATYFRTKIKSGELRSDIPVVPTLFTCPAHESMRHGCFGITCLLGKCTCCRKKSL